MHTGLHQNLQALGLWPHHQWLNAAFCGCCVGLYHHGDQLSPAYRVCSLPFDSMAAALISSSRFHQIRPALS
ncbi:hypothetical protein WJX84_005709 [Apatococcus fuscideae]|uniref:Uncharacterized protein n=1 Tax=Apatococcus fuscideae TaxID=2026836 RepID=A0AAW1SCM9_9CHLO